MLLCTTRASRLAALLVTRTTLAACALAWLRCTGCACMAALYWLGQKWVRTHTCWCNCLSCCMCTGCCSPTVPSLVYSAVWCFTRTQLVSACAEHVQYGLDVLCTGRAVLRLLAAAVLQAQPCCAHVQCNARYLCTAVLRYLWAAMLRRTLLLITAHLIVLPACLAASRRLP